MALPSSNLGEAPRQDAGIAINPTADETQRTLVEPEEGGVKGWLQVAGSFALYFNHL